jgi:hypothetical protein
MLGLPETYSQKKRQIAEFLLLVSIVSAVDGQDVAVTHGPETYNEKMKELFVLQEATPKMAEVVKEIGIIKETQTETTHGIAFAVSANMRTAGPEQFTGQETTAMKQLVNLVNGLGSQPKAKALFALQDFFGDEKEGKDVLEALLKKVDWTGDFNQIRGRIQVVPFNTGERINVQEDVLDKLGVKTVDIFALNADNWYVTGVAENSVRMLVMLLGDLVKDATDSVVRDVQNMLLADVQA